MKFSNGEPYSKFRAKNFGLEIDRFFRFFKTCVYTISYVAFKASTKAGPGYIPVTPYVDIAFDLAKPEPHEEKIFAYMLGEEYQKMSHQAHAGDYSRMIGHVLAQLQTVENYESTDFAEWRRLLRNSPVFIEYTTPSENLLLQMSMEEIKEEWRSSWL